MKEETPSSPVPFDLVILLEGSNIHSGDIKEVIKNNILPFAKSRDNAIAGGSKDTRKDFDTFGWFR